MLFLTICFAIFLDAVIIAANSCPGGAINIDETCQICPPGTFAKPGSYICLGCPAGTFSDNKIKGAVTCTKCPLGTTSDPGSSRCNLVCENPSEKGGCCPAGYFSLPNAVQCHPCSPGTFSQYGTIGSCTLCDKGEYQPASGASSCLKCDPDSISNAGAASCRLKATNIDSNEDDKKDGADDDDENKRRKVKYSSNFLLIFLRRTIKGINLLGCVLAIAGVFSVAYHMEKIPSNSLMKSGSDKKEDQKKK